MRNDARQPSAWVSISEYSRRYGLTRNTVYRLISIGQLESYRVLKIVRVKNLPPDRHMLESAHDVPLR